MGFDQRALQMLFNVMVITGITSSALMCYLRRRDDKKLPAFVPVPARVDEGAKELGGEAEGPAILNTTPRGDQDIRQYVARRSREWASTAKTS